METGRVALIRYVAPDGTPCVGSGLLVDELRVLTADHVAEGSGHRVECAGGIRDVVAVLRSGTPKVDLAVLSLRDPVEGFERLAFAQVDRSRVDRVGDCVAVGFPRWKKNGKQRGSVQVNGLVPTAEGLESTADSGLRAGLLTLVGDRIPGAPDIPKGTLSDKTISPWGGMSGAGVVASGMVVGVVRSHNLAAGGQSLTITPLSALDLLPPSRLRQFWDALGIDHTGALPTLPLSRVPAALERAVAFARSLAPRQLSHREEALRQLARFCAGEELYLNVTGEVRAGKTALMSWFAVHPPTGTVVVSHFIRRTEARRIDSEAFLNTMIEQFGAVAGLLPEATDPEAEYMRLMNAAANACAGSRKQLVMLVDGLDEDGSKRVGRVPIAGLLPAQPPLGLHLIVARRRGVQLPLEVPNDHPLYTARCLEIDQAAEAAESGRLAMLELDTQMRDPLGREVLLYVTASGGGLTASDIAELADNKDIDAFDIQGLIAGGLGSTLGCSPGKSASCGYVFRHHDLLAAAMARFNEVPGRMRRCHEAIDEWAESAVTAGWPDHTPEYLISGYPHMLENGRPGRSATQTAEELSRLATDLKRHNLLYRRTHSDAAALGEIRAAHRLWCRSGVSDLTAVASLTGYRHRLQNQNRAMPDWLPEVWAKLGDLDRAEQACLILAQPDKRAIVLSKLADMARISDSQHSRRLAKAAEEAAHSISDLNRQAAIIAQIAENIASFDLEYARKLAQAGEEIARSIGHWCLATVASSIAIFDPDWAEIIVRSIEDVGNKALAFTRIAEAVSRSDRDRARKLMNAAKRAGRSIDNTRSDEFSASLVRVLAILDPDRAEALARSISGPVHRSLALASVARSIASTDAGRAQEIARSIPEPVTLCGALADVAIAQATIAPARAEDIANSIPIKDYRTPALPQIAQAIAIADPDRAERVARAIEDPKTKAAALAAVAYAMADTDPARARQLAHDAEDGARDHGDPASDAEVLAAVASAMTPIDTPRARALADAAESRAWHIPPADGRRPLALLGVAKAIVACDPAHAERLAQSADRDSGAVILDARAVIAPSLAGVDPDRAEALARMARMPERRARSLADIARVVASSDRARALRLAQEAEEMTREWYPLLAVETLAGIAEIVASFDPERAIRLAGVAHDMTYDVLTVEPDPDDSGYFVYQVSSVRTDIAQFLVHYDPDHAEAIARSIPNRIMKARACVQLSAALSSDAARSNALLSFAEEVVRSIDNPQTQASALAEVAKAVAVVNPDQALEIPRSISEQFHAARSAIASAAAEGRAIAEDNPTQVRKRVCEGLLTDAWPSFLQSVAQIDQNSIVKLTDVLLQAFTDDAVS